MLTHKSMLNEMKDVPANRLEELYQFIHSLSVKTKKTEASRKKILSFGGAFKDMTNQEYSDFVGQTNKLRKNLFERKIKL